MSVLATEVSLSLTACRDGMLVPFFGVLGEIGELINFATSCRSCLGGTQTRSIPQGCFPCNCTFVHLFSDPHHKSPTLPLPTRSATHNHRRNIDVYQHRHQPHSQDNFSLHVSPVPSVSLSGALLDHVSPEGSFSSLSGGSRSVDTVLPTRLPTKILPPTGVDKLQELQLHIQIQMIWELQLCI